MTAAGELAVRRLSLEVTVPHDHPAPERVQQRLEDVARARLIPALSAILEPLAREDRTEVVLLRKLELDLELDASADPDALARTWAAAIASALAGALGDEQASGLVCFPNRARQLSRFVLDLCEGDAFDKWFHRPFAGLAALPISAALRTALLDEPKLGLAALSTLAPAALGRVLHAAGELECRRILSAIQELEAPGAWDETARTVLAARPRAEQATIAPDAPWQHALAWLALSLEIPERDPNQIASSVCATAARVIEALEVVIGSNDLGEIARERAQSTLAELSPELRRELSSTGSARDVAAPLWTPLGGLLLLLVRLDRFDWPEKEDGGLARLLVLARAAGEARGAQAMRDPVVRLLVGLGDEPADDEAVRRALRDLDVAGRARDVFADFVAGLPGFSQSSRAFVWDNFLDFDAELTHDALGFRLQLGRPKLHALLTLIGALRGSVELPWLSEPLTWTPRP